ncbi:MAG: DUF3786 domain-containing protein [Synergistaceae bacterium]|jgi:hypothetical protein|nr:DUF3786 domain-containing protein [Synergistaceae bacterium]
MTSGYEKIYSTILPKLAECNLAENAPRLGAEATEGGFHISFLRRKYLITNEGVTATDGRPVDVNNRSVIIYYITSNGAGELSYDFALLERLTGMIAGRNDLASGVMHSPLVREFGGDYEKFKTSITKLGGVEEPPSGPGKHVWRLLALPKILSQIVYYEADDEFPADIQIMFDKTSPRFLDFECLAFLSGCMIRALIDEAGAA